MGVPIIRLGGTKTHQELGRLIDGVGYFNRVTERKEDGTLTSCTVSAYKWNVESNIFEYSEMLSNKWELEECSSLT